MMIHRLSIKSLTITILIVIAGFSVLLSFVSGDYFFKAARESQVYSLQRVIQVATKEIMQELYEQTYDVASTLSVEGNILNEFTNVNKTDGMTKLVTALEDPFITGFVGAYIIELVQIRVYDLELKLMAESKTGVQGLPQQMPDSLYQLAYERKGIARTKTIYSLWLHADEPYYSVLVPMGGVFVSGYLEVVVNPVNNLLKLSGKMDSPVSIQGGINTDKIYYEPDTPVTSLLPIEYVLETNLGTPAYLLTSYENIAKLSEGVRQTVFDTISIFIGLVLIVLFIAIWLFQLFLFRPINLVLSQIRNITEGDDEPNDLKIKGVTEITILAEEFHKMAKKIRSREKALRQLSTIDELTKIANRRKFDEILKNEYLLGCRSGRPLSILMIDIDYFKLFNDTYGHIAGDDCIRAVAAAIKTSLHRPADSVARYGGEEFAVILPDTTESGERVTAEKIMREIAKLNIPHSTSMVDDKITVSIGGYSVVPSIQDDPVFIVAEADKSLYQAKDAGRKQCVLRSEAKDTI